MTRVEPSIVQAAKLALAGTKQDLGFLRLDSQAFATVPSISVDHAMMERTG